MSGIHTPLKFAVLMDSNYLNEWQYKTIKELEDKGVAQLDLIIICKEINNNSSVEKENFSKNFIYRLWGKIFPPLLQANLDFREVFRNVNTLNLQVLRRGKYRHYFSEEDIKKVKVKNLDFILRFGLNIIEGDILNSSKFGIWSFHHGDERKYRGRPANFWEIYDNQDTVGGILQVLNEKLDSGIILERWSIKNKKTSVRKSYKELCLSGIVFPRKVCQKIIEGSIDIANLKPSKTQAKIKYLPNNFQMINFILKISINKVISYIERFYQDDWKVGVGKLDFKTILEGKIPQINNWYEVKGGFVADPFISRSNNNYFILAERYINKIKKGHLVRLDLSKGLDISNESELMNLNTHLSYPNIFKFESRNYLIPENKLSGSTKIYELDDDLKIKKIVNEIKKQLADPTVVFYKDMYWMFALEGFDNLVCWYTTNPLGKWKEHIANPLKIDISKSRPAGDFFFFKDSLYRPSMDCSKSYGEKIAINKVKILNTREYEEEFICYLNANSDWEYNQGVHNISFCEDYFVIDAKKRVFKNFFHE